MDNATNKPREIDLIVEKRWEQADDFNKTLIIFEIRLFIECKYINQPNVFWFADKDIISATELVVSNTPLKKDNPLTHDHHYLAESRKVAKMFASSKMPSLDNEVMYKAINQSLNAMIYLRGRDSLSPAVSTTLKRKPVLLEMPVVVCNSFADFYGVDMTDTSSCWKIDDNFQLEVNYAYLEANAKRKNEYFLLDIVDFNSLDKYLSILHDDKNAIMSIVYKYTK